jgi:peptidoglycan hydrolase CwlO-like protein
MDWNAYDERTAGLLKIAAESSVLSRKNLGKDYDKVLKEFQKIKAQFDDAMHKQKEAQKIVESLQGRMDELKNTLIGLGQKMRDADLVGAHSIRERKEGPTFMIGKDEYVLDKDDDGNMATVMYRDWKKNRAKAQKDLEEQDAEDSADSQDGQEFSADVSFGNDQDDFDFVNDIANIETKFR